MFSHCLCQNLKRLSFFIPIIRYGEEKAFPHYKGAIIGRCNNCGILKTLIKPVHFPYVNGEPRHRIYEENPTYFRGLFQPLINQITIFKKNGRLLDVGCSTGILLSLLKDTGFVISGLEPNKQAFQTAKKKLGNVVFNMKLPYYIKKFHPAPFDVIVYNHVLEHIEKVDQELIKACSILAEDGILAIGVPNRQNVIFSLRQKYWESLLPQEHIWHFSPYNLKTVLESLRLKIVDIRFHDDERKDYPWLKKKYFHSLSLLNRLLNTGEAITIIAKKEAVG